MVLNMADFGKSWKSFQTLWNDCKTVLKWFVTACATVCVDLGWIRKGRKLDDFEHDSYTLANGFLTPGGTVCVDFRWIRKGPKSTVFEQKAWAIAHGFEQVGFW